MRRFFTLMAFLLGAASLGGCGEQNLSLLPETEEEDSQTSQPGVAADIFDGTSDAPGANSRFFFLNPFTKSKLKPNQVGTFDPTQEPVVTICPLDGSWDFASESCNPEEALAEYFTSDTDPFGDQVVVLPSNEKYQVVYKTQNYPMIQGVTYRVAVSIYEQNLGWADMAVYDPSNPEHSPGPGNFTQDDVLLLNGTENQNISFRIDEGALEEEFCDTTNLEDCDVVIVDPNAGATLRVFEGTQALGALAQIPPGILGPDGLPFTNPFPAVLELELDGNPQPGSVPATRQVPYFADFWSPVEGLYFDRDAQGAVGMRVVVCQDLEGTGSIPEYLHDFLVLFLTQTDASGTFTELVPTEPGAEECAGFDGTHAHEVASANEQRGIFGKLASSLSRATRFLLPQPLYAKRRLHGGLNTVTWELSRDDGKGGDGEAAPEAVGGIALTQPEPVLLQFGAVLNADADATSAAVTVPDGNVGEPTTVTVRVLDALDQPFLFEVGVTVEVSGANEATVQATYQGNGEYSAQYTPTASGEDTVDITLEEEPYLPATLVGPFTSTVYPVGPSAANTSFSVSYSEAGSPTTVTVTVLDENDPPQPYTDGEAFPIQVAITVEDGETVLETLQATDEDGDGVYVASYTPSTFGTFQINVLIGADGAPIVDLTPVSGSPLDVTTAPRPADASQSEILVGDGQAESTTPVSVVVRNTAGELYDVSNGAAVRPVTVDVTVSGANQATFQATDPEGDGTYEGSYIPLNPGTDFIDAVITDPTDDTVDDVGVPQATSEVAPLSGPMTVEIQISGPAPAYEHGLPVQLFDGTGSLLDEVLTDATGTAQFADVPYGFSYSVYLPKRDFDVEYTDATKVVDFDKNTGTVIFTGTNQLLPESVLVWRVGYDQYGNFGGNGNAYEYTVGGRSWTSANNQVRDYFLLGVDGHLATLTTESENTFVASFFTLFDNLCPGITNPKQCKFKGWIGLSDEMVEGAYEWVTSEVYDPNGFTGWPDAIEPEDRRGNEDYVEINFEGHWNITNGASTTNEGYFTEWEATQPPTFGT